MTRRGQAFTCYGLALGLALAVALLGPDAVGGMQILTMLTPAVSVLLMMRFATDRRGRRSSWHDLGLGRAGLRLWPLAVMVPAAVVAASYALASVVYPVSWSFRDGAAMNLTANIVVISTFAIFEEVCWRGYLLPRLDEGGAWAASAAVGLMHGVWHLPLIVLTTAYNPVGNRWIVIPLFLALLTTAGVVYGWLRTMSASLWPVVIAHGTFNAVLATASESSQGRDENTLAYLTGETGVMTLIAVGIAGCLMSWYATPRRATAVRTYSHATRAGHHRSGATPGHPVCPHQPHHAPGPSGASQEP